MKRILLIILLFSATVIIPQLLTPVSANEVWTIQTGLNIKQGILYNRNLEPGNSGAAVSLSLERQSGKFLFEAGTEAGFSFSGFDLLFPIKSGILITDKNQLQFSAHGSIMPGLILSRPAPYFLSGFEINARLRWQINKKFSLALIAGPRFTISPGYSEAVAPLELVDLNIGISSGFRR